jgi:hypothetical protein
MTTSAGRGIEGQKVPSLCRPGFLLGIRDPSYDRSSEIKINIL